MISVTVGDFKSRFSDYLDSVINGEDVEILYGRAKKPVAEFTKINDDKKQSTKTLTITTTFDPLEFIKKEQLNPLSYSLVGLAPTSQ